VVRQETDIAKVPTKDYGLKLRGRYALTGPIYMDGAEPGDMFEIRILARVVPRPA
jgi:acetamidase/formamidase